MNEEQKVARIMQITTKNGIHIQIGVSDVGEYKTRKDAILKSTKDFVTVIDTCTVSRQDISIIEYFEMTEEQVQTEQSKKRGVLPWRRK